MKLTRLTAALIAAVTAITPLSFNASVPISYAEDTGAVAKLPDWIPSDFDSAVEFRNSYGATHIDNGLICLVYPDRARKGRSADTYGYELKPTVGMGLELKHEIYTHELTETCFDVFVYQPWAQGDVTLTITDPHVQVKPSEKETGDDWEPPAIAEYTFTLDKSLNITETDIFSWLPDSTKEFREYLRTNGEVSARDNYVVFCTVTVEQFGDRWEANSTNKNEIIKPILSSDCTKQVSDLYEDGSIDWIHVYQAVQDGNEKISWTRTSTIRPNPDEPTSYTITADCAVLDNAQTVLLANTARFSIIDGETGKLVDIDENDKIFLNPDIRYASGEEGVYASIDLAAQQMTSNPYYWDISQFKDADIFEVGLLYNNIPEGYSLDTAGTVVRKFDNGAIDYTFKLKFTPTGDVNDDGEFNVADVVLLQKWLLAVPDTHLANWKAANFCDDDRLNVFDLCLMKRALIEQRISEGQPVLYCEGEKIGESDEKGWYSTEYSNVITDKQLKDNPDILSRLDKVNAKADELKSTQMIDWKWGVEDYGEDYLYLPYVDENGNADRILLCKFGWDCAWLDDADVQMLVSMLIGNGYYADKTLFEYYIEDQ